MPGWYLRWCFNAGVSPHWDHRSYAGRLSQGSQFLTSYFRSFKDLKGNQKRGGIFPIWTFFICAESQPDLSLRFLLSWQRQEMVQKAWIRDFFTYISEALCSVKSPAPAIHHTWLQQEDASGNSSANLLHPERGQRGLRLCSFSSSDPASTWCLSKS